MTMRHAVPVTVDFGNPNGPGQDTTAYTTVSAPWVRDATAIILQPCGWDTEDHDGLDTVLEQVTAYAYNRQPGVSFDVVATAPDGTWGRHTFIAIG